MTSNSKRKKFRWLVLPLFLFIGFGTIQAQSFVEPNEAMIKLELKLADIYNGAEDGTVLLIDKKIADKFINKTAIEINSNQPIATALENAFTATNEAYALYTSNVVTLKNQITTLLEKED